MQRPVIVAKPAFFVVTLVVFVAAPPVFARAAQDQEVQTAQPSAASSDATPIPKDRVIWHVPDPELDRQTASQRLAEAREAGDTARANYITRLLERLDSIRRPLQIRLTLEDIIRRTLANSFTIQTLSYSPAIDTTRVVEAEAAFDAVFFTNLIKNNVDRPTGSQLISTDLDLFTLDSGIRKRLPTGALVSGQYGLRRTKAAFAFQVINPEYFSTFVTEMRQPILRGFGLDFNRSVIVIAKNDRRLSDLAFRRQIRDTLREVEELYWRLVQARRDVVITARELADFEDIYEYVVSRRDFDMTPVQIESTRADLELARADFVRRRASVFDVEDRLIATMNDAEINLADQIEIIPQDIPTIEGITVDRLGEVQTALDKRPEVFEQKLRVANAKVAVGRAENLELPRLDLTFRTTFNGLGGNADQSFDELTRNKFIEYFIGVELEVPIGNRGPRAASRRARLQHAQAVAQLRNVLEDVILDVNLAVRELGTTYDQIAPAFESAEARERQVGSIVARAERKDINTLQTELNARRALAATRRGLVNVMVDYNIAITDLARATGTLLEHNNIVIPTEGAGSGRRP